MFLMNSLKISMIVTTYLIVVGQQLIGDDVDYESIILEKFPNCNVEVIQPGFLDIEMLKEYITDDIIIYKPHNILVYKNLIRFMVNIGEKGKIYYLEGFSDDDLKVIHTGILKFAYGRDTTVNLFKNADPDREILDL